MEFDSNLLSALLPAVLVLVPAVVAAVVAAVALEPKPEVEVVLPSPEPGAGTCLARDGGLGARLDFLCARR